MKKAVMFATVIILLAVSARAAEFWDVYADRLAKNYSVKAGAIPRQGEGDLVDESEITALLTKSFSQSFGIRFSQNARDRRALVFVCVFSNEPEKCYVDPVVRATFSETKILRSPSFSQKFLKRAIRKYSHSLSKPDSISATKVRSEEVPNWKAFNPRFAVDINELDLIVASPFHTFAGVYAEPRFSVKDGPAVKLMKGRAAVDFRQEGVVFNYLIKGESDGTRKVKITIKPEGEIYIDNVVFFW
jgi:hypothetical protein